MSNDSVIDAVAAVCGRFGAVSVILFGSRATGFATEKSDIDIAVKGSNVDFAAIEREIEKIPTLYSVNIVDFSKASDNLRKDINSYGKLLYEA
jgi:predicted nucleotidyltransferase